LGIPREVDHDEEEARHTEQGAQWRATACEATQDGEER